MQNIKRANKFGNRSSWTGEWNELSSSAAPAHSISISLCLHSSAATVDIVMQEQEQVQSQFEPMNQDTLEAASPADNSAKTPSAIFLSVSMDDQEPSSTCLTPVSSGMDLELDLSMVANKGSMTLSVDVCEHRQLPLATNTVTSSPSASQGFEEDEEATLSAATTPSLPADHEHDQHEPRLELCYCCPTHAEPPPEVASDDPKYSFALPVTHITKASPEHARPPVRRAHDPISPRMQKQISLFECNEASALHASINLPAAAQQLRQDARLRKFENLTQSTSNSNFPFESNTLKRVPLVSTKDDYANVSHTQSCINLKSSGTGTGSGSGSGSLVYGSPQHHQHRERERDRQHSTPPASASALGNVKNFNRLPNALSVCCSLDIDAGCSAGSPTLASTSAAAAAAATAAAGSSATTSATMPENPPHPGALIVKERFIEPPKRGIVRGYHAKTQSMDADFLFNEFLLLPAIAPPFDHDHSHDYDIDLEDCVPAQSKEGQPEMP